VAAAAIRRDSRGTHRGGLPARPRPAGEVATDLELLGYLAWAELVEQRDPRNALDRAQEALLAAQEANDDLALGWANLYKGWALSSLGDHEDATTTLNELAFAFDRAAYAAGAAQARSIASQPMNDGAAGVE
jgi:hypothetical protein